MPAKRPHHDDPAESKRFIDMAREVGADESPEAFDRAFGSVDWKKKPEPESKGNSKPPSSTKRRKATP